ncbi:MAG: septum formation initiator family protein [Rickettsia sp.]|nr:septum formation initiator family protein [Rickettsia sp.]
MFRLKILNLVFFVISSYFVFYSFYGDRGYFSYIKSKEYFKNTYDHLNKLRVQRLVLLNDLELLQSDSYELDLLDEYSRKIMGYVSKGELFFNVQQFEHSN